MIQKIKPNTYQIKISVFDKAKGYSIVRQRTITGSKFDAEEAQLDLRKQLKAEINSSLIQEFSISTFTDAIALYRNKLKVKDKLSKQHELMIDLIDRELGHLKLDVVPDYFKRLLDMLEATPPKGREKRCPASINRRVAIVKAVFNHLVKIEYIDKNPITEARGFIMRAEKPRDRVLSVDEQLRLMNTIRAHRPHIEPIIAYMMRVPCRVSELMNATKTQYNAMEGTIYIPDSKAGIPIYKPVLDFREYFDNIPPDCPWLFYWIDENGEYRKFNSLRKAFAFCLKKSGIQNLRIHDLRHIAATNLYESGVSEREIMDIAGWKTTMLSTYRHRDSFRTAQKLNAKRAYPEESDALNTTASY